MSSYVYDNAIEELLRFAVEEEARAYIKRKGWGWLLYCPNIYQELPSLNGMLEEYNAMQRKLRWTANENDQSLTGWMTDLS